MSHGSAIHIPDNYKAVSVDSVQIPAHYMPYVGEVMITEQQLQDRVVSLASEIFDTLQPVCKDEGLIAVCVLKGSFAFFSKLMEAISRLNSAEVSLKLDFEFITARSYENDRSTGNVGVSGFDSLKKIVPNRRVLIVEDIVDTGNTLKALLARLEEFNPKEIKVASLLLKRTPLHNGIMPHFTGFSVPDHFIVGYGLDYNQNYRDLRHICVINEAGKEKFAQH